MQERDEDQNVESNPTGSPTKAIADDVNDGASNDGVSNDGVSNDGVSNDGVSNDGVSNDGVGNDGVGNDGVGNDSEKTSEENEKNKTPAFDFTLVDQYGNEHTLSDYKGKVVFLNFWATWCGPCKKEMPDIEKLYQEYGQNQSDIIILGVANPASSDYPNNIDISKKEIVAFLDHNEYTFPTVFDETGDVFDDYFISAYPTTFLIDKEGNIFGYASGMLTKDIMYNVIQQALDQED